MAVASLAKAKSAKRESKYVEFKDEFDVHSTGAWCEIIKDIVALANSGGGLLIVGLRNNGTLSGFDVTDVLGVDPAHVADKVKKYTGEDFSDFQLESVERDGSTVAGIRVEAARVPLVFTSPGTYPVSGGKQQTAFSKGSVYFRHGAKSEPGTSQDLRDWADRYIERVRSSWLSNIRKVIEAPPDVRLAVVEAADGPGPTMIRLVDDPTAPVYGRLSPDVTHPHRQKELTKLVNVKFGGKHMITSHDLLAVRKTLGIDESRREARQVILREGCQRVPRSPAPAQS